MEVEEERIGLVLFRVSQLRSKLSDCIHKATVTSSEDDPPSPPTMDPHQETESLLYISDAFASLDSQLSSLQALQQQQQYEREAVIGEIEYSRKRLLKKIGEYKGEYVDVIREAEAFASMKVEHGNELLLPPYPTHSHLSVVLDNDNPNRISHTRKLTQNGYNNGVALTNGSKRRSEPQPSSHKLWSGLKFVVNSTAKTMLTLVGVISLLSLAGFEPRLNKKGANLKSLTFFQQTDEEEKRCMSQCPRGKVAVMEDGEIRFVVKERVEIPFDSVAGDPDVSYGCG